MKEGGSKVRGEEEVSLHHILLGKFHDKHRRAWNLSLDLNIRE